MYIESISMLPSLAPCVKRNAVEMRIGLAYLQFES
jgi:hypothetical protein